MNYQLEVFADTQCLLGEGCHWNSQRQSLFWVDILDKKIFEKGFDKPLQIYDLPCLATAIFQHEDYSTVLLVTERGIATFNLVTKTFRCFIEFDLTNTPFRPNDAGIDPYGNIIFGTMQRTPNQYIGSVYKVSYDGKITKLIDGIGIPNTFRWTPDGNTFYIADSLKQEMYQFAYDQEGIKKDSQRLFFSLKDSIATPDGSTISQDGLLWNAQWGGYKVGIYDTAGTNIGSIPIPVPQPTSCTFGGINNQTLFITTARTELSYDQLINYPQSGAVFMASISDITKV